MEQLSFEKAFELADIVAQLIRVETEKKELNEDFNARIKLYKKQIIKLSGEIERERTRVSA